MQLISLSGLAPPRSDFFENTKKYPLPLEIFQKLFFSPDVMNKIATNNSGGEKVPFRLTSRCVLYLDKHLLKKNYKSQIQIPGSLHSTTTLFYQTLYKKPLRQDPSIEDMYGALVLKKDLISEDMGEDDLVDWSRRIALVDPDAFLDLLLSVLGFTSETLKCVLFFQFLNIETKVFSEGKKKSFYLILASEIENKSQIEKILYTYCRGIGFGCIKDNLDFDFGPDQYPALLLTCYAIISESENRPLSADVFRKLAIKKGCVFAKFKSAQALAHSSSYLEREQAKVIFQEYKKQLPECWVGLGRLAEREGKSDEAIKFYTEALARAGEGATSGLVQLLQIHNPIEIKIAEDTLKKAVQLLGLAARRGSKESQLLLGMFYFFGWGLEKAHPIALIQQLKKIEAPTMSAFNSEILYPFIEKIEKAIANFSYSHHIRGSSDQRVDHPPKMQWILRPKPVKFSLEPKNPKLQFFAPLYEKGVSRSKVRSMVDDMGLFKKK